MVLLASEAAVHEDDLELLLDKRTSDAELQGAELAEQSLRGDLSSLVLYEGRVARDNVRPVLLSALKASWLEHFTYLCHSFHPFRDLWLFSVVRPKALNSLLYGCTL